MNPLLIQDPKDYLLMFPLQYRSSFARSQLYKTASFSS